MLEQPTEEQSILRDTLARYLRDRGEREGGQWPADAQRLEDWRSLAGDLGMVAAPFPEELGGLGGGFTEHQLMLEELGRALWGEPYLSTVVFAGSLLKQSGGAHARELVPRIIAGECVVAVAYLEEQSRGDVCRIDTTLTRKGANLVLSGRKIVVDAAPWATHLIVSARSAGQQDVDAISLVLLERDTPGIKRRDYRTVDGMAASNLDLDSIRIEPSQLLGEEAGSAAILRRAFDETALGYCAEALGVLRRMLDDTVDYTQQRRQFGRAIAEFQVLQHRMVDMYVELEQAISITHMAADQLAEDENRRAQAVSAARWLVGRACRLIAQEAVQIHGAIGTTDEIALSRYFKRATLFESRFGSGEYHLQRYARLMQESGR